LSDDIAPVSACAPQSGYQDERRRNNQYERQEQWSQDDVQEDASDELSKKIDHHFNRRHSGA
jgi:hypothetical protein